MSEPAAISHLRPSVGKLAMVLLAVTALTFAGAGIASARTICVRETPGGGCRSLQKALAVARPGDTIELASGSYDGGLHIDKSLRLIGAGAEETTIQGGGPVLTIGRFMGTHRPKVTIESLGIQWGRNDGNGVEAFGGGVYIPPAKGYRPGARVTMRHVHVDDNIAAPTRSRRPGPGQAKSWPRCPEGPCRFAIALGGGIDSWGSLTIEHSEVNGNVAGGNASDADGGGIASSLGPLRIVDTEISQNTAKATWAKSRFAEGGGVFVTSGWFRMVESELLQNSANLQSKLGGHAGKATVEMNANSAGVHVGDGVPTTVVDSSFLQNTVHAADRAAAPSAFDSGMLMGDAPVTMNGVSFEQNDAYTTAGETPEGSGSVLEVDGGGRLEHLNFEMNESHIVTLHGNAEVGAALAILNFNEDAKPAVVSHSRIVENESFARSPNGIAKVTGAGVLNDSLLTLDGVTIAANHAHAAGGGGGFARGGGIWNGADVSGPPVKLAVKGSSIRRNTVSGSANVSVAGGGIFSSAPLSLSTTTFLANRPEDCSGTGCP